MPVSKYIPFKYIEEQLSINVAAGTTYQYYTFRGNSLYDPNQSGVGTQPYAYDQWCAFMNRYKVYASKITVYIDSVTAATLDPYTWVCGISPYGDVSLPYTTQSDLVSIPGTKAMRFTPDPTTDRKKWKVKNYKPTRFILGQVSDNNFQATIGANPDWPWYWIFWVAPTLGVTGITNVRFSVKIVYYSKMFQAISLQNS